MERQADNTKCWYVRTPENSVYGPASFAELVAWAAEARIVPGCVLSRDRINWEPADQQAELRMEWWVDLAGGNQIGPLHLYAISDLVREGVIAAGAVLANPKRKITARVGEELMALIADEARRDLATQINRDVTTHTAILSSTPGVQSEVARNAEILAAAEEAYAAKIAALEQASTTQQERIQELEIERSAADIARITLQEQIRAAAAALEAERTTFGVARLAIEEQLKAATAANDVERATFDTTRIKLEEQLIASTTALDAMKVSLSQVETDLQNRNSELRLRDDQLRGTGDELDAAHRKIAAMEQQQDEQLRKAHSQLDESRRKIAEFSAEAEAVREAQAQREAQWHGQKEVLETGLAATRKSAAEFQNRLAAAEKNHGEELKQQQQSMAGLQTEIVRLQKEAAVTASVLERTVAELESAKSKRGGGKKAIDWMDAGRQNDATPDAAGVLPDAMRTETALRTELRAVTTMYARVEKELAKQHELFNAAQVESGERETALNSLVDQLKRDIESSTAVVRQSMQEVERRENEYRNLRRQGEKREMELLERIAILEKSGRPSDLAGTANEHVVPEVLPPLPPLGREPVEPPVSEPATILAGLEAQAQMELEAWRRKESLSQDESSRGKFKNWLRRKQQ